MKCLVEVVLLRRRIDRIKAIGKKNSWNEISLVDAECVILIELRLRMR